MKEFLKARSFKFSTKNFLQLLDTKILEELECYILLSKKLVEDELTLKDYKKYSILNKKFTRYSLDLTPKGFIPGTNLSVWSLQVFFGGGLELKLDNGLEEFIWVDFTKTGTFQTIPKLKWWYWIDKNKSLENELNKFVKALNDFNEKINFKIEERLKDV